MKLSKKTDTFGDAFSRVLKENAGTMVGTIASGRPSGDKYTPPTIEPSPPIRTRNDAVNMGQDASQTSAPSQLIYPFESIYGALIDQYILLTGLRDKIEHAKKLPTLSPVKTKTTEDALNELENAIKYIKKCVLNIEKLSL